VDDVFHQPVRGLPVRRSRRMEPGDFRCSNLRYFSRCLCCSVCRIHSAIGRRAGAIAPGGGRPVESLPNGII
jgi:hypothetical protein